MTSITQTRTIMPSTSSNEPIPLPGHGRRRRAAHSHAGQGTAMLAATQTLPMSVSRGFIFPVAGAVLGAFLLGTPGVFLGGFAGWLLGRR